MGRTSGRDRGPYSEYLTFAVELAHGAGQLTRALFGQKLQIERKSDNSPVTRADREAELYLRARIAERYPLHAIVGEEFGRQTADSPMGALCWYLDPIDGTEAFVHGIPLYTVLIALVEGDEPRVGVIHNPILEETVCAAAGGGCYYNNEPCHVSDCRQIERARLMVSDMAELARRRPDLMRSVIPLVGIGRTWADAFGYLLVASGRVDIMLDPIMSPWDIAPLYPIIEEAGGAICDFAGRRSPLGDSVLACAPALFDRLKATIAISEKAE